MSHCLGQTHHGVFRKSVEHAFFATLYASCLFYPVHLSWKQNKRIAFTTSLRFVWGHSWTGVLKNALMGCWDMVFATQGRKDTVE